jgi:hypothetical protein
MCVPRHRRVSGLACLPTGDVSPHGEEETFGQRSAEAKHLAPGHIQSYTLHLKTARGVSVRLGV